VSADSAAPIVNLLHALRSCDKVVGFIMGAFASERFLDRQELNPLLIRALLLPYGLKLRGCEPAKSGSGATTLLLRTDEGPAVMKIYREWGQAAENVRRRYEFVQFLRSRRLPVPRVFADRSGELLSSFSTDSGPWMYVLMERLQGRPHRYAEVAFLPAIARLQAALHRASASYNRYTPGSADPEFMLEYFGKLCRRVKRHLHKLAVPEIFLHAAEDVHQVLTKSFQSLRQLPSGLVHGDYDSHNILVRSGKVAGIYDFDNLGDDPFIADLGSSLSWFCSRQGWDDGLVSRYLTAYRRVRPISLPEFRALPLFVRVQNLSDALHLHIIGRRCYTAERWQRVADINVAAIEWERRIEQSPE
jgi:Ser/Thr protein kinase RdoA (MazF antagonist)